MRFHRILSAAVLVALAAGALTSCDSKIGLAATVDGHRLTDSTLSGFVQPGAKPYADPQSGGTVTPKLYALENWVENQIFASTVAAHGGQASEQELTSARSAVLGSNSVNDFAKQLEQQGYTRSLVDVIIDQSATLVVLVERLARVSAAQAVQALQAGTINTQLLSTIRSTKPAIDISSRYGQWDAKNFRLSADSAAGAPGFVTFPGSNGGTLQPETAP